ncbi:hypothetical protein SPRG_02579 [Saprolegnia parasitica CBS 223.65]|uniref:AAA+ ATPase domain-containing protein n=1 Tax=Saprolegnia parasitica (strain CBS 223.65) TaxID=695850 RepID=A0A067CQU9_SAPPC|nr:hypothetical protein SPRG_02579 [Saprolegnia parasitica CBS 223.65]KDO32888.1 hypothetical protein SPRG_02579 [Saprolegnia parasitica CBS 223.65]|eukprot:XP_012196538.1 hypothetical protein SPRG_02579 [Saprolegnia parasitica CBS 223.65]
MSDLGRDLYVSASSGNAARVAFLIQEGANVNWKIKNGTTPLYIAAMRGREEVVRLLLQAGADPHAICNNETAYTAAYRNSYFSTADHIKTAMDRCPRPSEFVFADVAAAQQNNSNRAQLEGLGVCLSKAALLGDVGQVRELLGQGANVHWLNSHECTPLFAAAINDHDEVVGLLLDANANVNHTSKDGLTPLMVAVRMGHAIVVRRLLSAGAKVNCKDNDGITALYAASNGGHADAVQLLLCAGADVNWRNNDGNTALYAASNGGHADAVQLLLCAGADNGDTALHEASRWGYADAVKFLLGAGADINWRNSDGDTALQLARKEGHADVAKLLLGAESPLQKAVRSDNVGQVERLLRTGNMAMDERLRGVVFASPWDGVSLVAHPALQQELISKLQCVSSRASPFAGINLLRALQLSKPIPELDLLYALELLHLPGDDATAVTSHIENYLRHLVLTGSTAHPILLLALGRWLMDLAFVKAFATKYPNATDAWLLPAEKQHLAPAPAESPSPHTDLCTRQLWATLPGKPPAAAPAMDALLNLVGIPKVKQFAIGLFQTSAALAKMTPEMRQKNPISLNYCFVGNAGTGKTTVARHFATLLHASKLRSKDVFVETDARQLKDAGAPAFDKLVQSALDGVLFIDEAYDLDPMGDLRGKPIVAALLTAAENLRDRITIILAGYETDLQTKLFDFNAGLKSRFQFVTFEDFDVTELAEVCRLQVAARGWTAPRELATLVAKKLIISANTKGFGNARSVRQEVEAATQRAMARPTFCGQSLVLCLEDVMAEHVSGNPKLQRYMAELEAKIGWAAVKKSVKELLALCAKNQERTLAGKAPLPVRLHRLFLGNPGTGKTTCAALYGRILKELRLLSSGDVVLKTASDLMGEYVGEAQQRTLATLEQAKGKVLVIDEAYVLNDAIYGKDVLNVLVEKVQSTGREDIAVLLLGYEAQMLTMLREQNPGLARRFPREAAFVFEDYSAMELLQLLEYTCKQEEVTCSSMAMEVALNVLEKQKSLANFGNAGAVNTLVHHAMAKASLRPGTCIVLQPDDFSDAKAVSADPFAALDGLFGMATIKKALLSLRNAMLVARADGDALPALGHFVFRGSPGTGKTTVARALATILFQLDLLTVESVVETTGLELTADFLGQTKTVVQEKLSAANGGILFIDEAYALAEGMYGREAVATLVAAMTDPTYKSLVIVVAGYPREMDAMLTTNGGLKSRFTRFFDFPDWSPEDCVAFVKTTMTKSNFVADENVHEALATYFGVLRTLPGWGNGRDVQSVWKAVLGARADRIAGLPAQLPKRILEADVETACGLHVRRHDGNGRGLCCGVARPERTKEAMRYDEARHTGEKATMKACQRDAGVSDTDWAELEAAKQAHEAHLAEWHRELDAQALAKKLKEEAEVQERIRRLCKCPMGFEWFQLSGGWRCGGGSHFVTDAELNAKFTA